MATPKKPVYQFPRNQCIACNNVILDRHHPVLLFGNNKEAENIRLRFETLTTIRLHSDDSYPKKICVRCKVKLDAAVGFKDMCLFSRKDQEAKLSRVKRGRNNYEQSISPNSKRSVGGDEGNKSCNAENVVTRYRQIFPNTRCTTTVGVQGVENQAEEPHLLSKCGTGNPRVSV